MKIEHEALELNMMRAQKDVDVTICALSQIVVRHVLECELIEIL